MNNAATRRLVVCVALVVAWASCARALESTQELRLGGIALTQSGDSAVMIEAADITINPDSVVAKYRLVNNGPAPAAITLTFSMPDLDFSDPDVAYAIPGSDPVNFVGLNTRTGGVSGGFGFTQAALLHGKDITAVLRQNKLALVPVGTFQNQLAAMAPDQREKLSQAGLLTQNGNDIQGNPLYFPTWTVRTSGSKRHTFAPGQPVELELRYRTSLGMSIDTPLRNPLRAERANAAQIQKYKNDYCIDDAFYTGLDKIAAPGEANTSKLRERRMVFALRGRSPSTPIKDFRLVVDKGRADRVVSFCLNNLKRISPTAFEMRATDFVADRDLMVLLIGRN